MWKDYQSSSEPCPLFHSKQGCKTKNCQFSHKDTVEVAQSIETGLPLLPSELFLQQKPPFLPPLTCHRCSDTLTVKVARDKSTKHLHNFSDSTAASTHL